jgi:Ca-activated chloride channel family protein
VPKLDFAAPALLLLALAVPPLVWWWLRRHRPALSYPGVGFLAALPPGKARVARRGGAILRGLALLMVVVAVAGPRTPDLRTRIDTEGIAIFFAVDVSGSMKEQDFDWFHAPVSRLDAAKHVFHLFVEGGEAPGGNGSRLEARTTDLIGYVAFATRPERVCPLTLSHSTLLKMLDAELPRTLPTESSTNLSDALTIALHRLEHADSRPKVLILLTDGEHNVPDTKSKMNPLQAARLAASLGIPIYTIDAGGNISPGDDPHVPDAAMSSKRDTRAAAITSLNKIADISHGRYFLASNTDALLEACRKIDELERPPITSLQYRRYYDLAVWPAVGAFLFWVTALILEATLWRRVP